MQRPGVSTILITQEQVFRGLVMTRGRRLLDILDDPLTDYVLFYESQIFHSLEMQTPIATFPSACVRKAALSLVIIQEEQHEAPQKRMFSFVQRRVYPAFVVVPGYEVRGRVHVGRLVDPITLMARDFGPFFPVTQAVVAHTMSEVTLQVPVVLVQKAAVSLFCLEEMEQ